MNPVTDETPWMDKMRFVKQNGPNVDTCKAPARWSPAKADISRTLESSDARGR